MRAISELKLAVIGLGYVGLPLAVEFSKRRPVVGFDINAARIASLREGRDLTRELDEEELRAAGALKYSTDTADLVDCNVYIVTVPTPVDEHKQPDLGGLLSASTTIGRVLKRGDIVIYESTVYPGATEEDCVPVLEKVSGLKFNTDFFVGYSPERINPGDKLRRVATIKKITSGSTPEIADLIDELYRQIVTAGTHKAPSIKVAEAAKVIENTQRDLNIAIVNEFAMIFNRLGIDTEAVLTAAGTKWNFLPFRPGLVGGHCTGVDPYYLSHRAQAAGYYPEIILAGRRLNDSMGPHVASQLVKAMVKRRIHVVGAQSAGLGPRLQGKLSRSAQYQDCGLHPGTLGFRRDGPRRGPLGHSRRGEARIRHRSHRRARSGNLRRRNPRRRPRRIQSDGRAGRPRLWQAAARRLRPEIHPCPSGFRYPALTIAARSRAGLKNATLGEIRCFLEPPGMLNAGAA